jgi:hypothetical protein
MQNAYDESVVASSATALGSLSRSTPSNSLQSVVTL